MPQSCPLMSTQLLWSVHANTHMHPEKERANIIERERREGKPNLFPKTAISTRDVWLQLVEFLPSQSLPSDTS